MLYEDQQVGRPVLQLLYTVEVFALVICLEVRERTNTPQRQVRTKKHDITFLKKKFTHISQIILKILILSPDDAHGWVRALSPKHTLLW